MGASSKFQVTISALEIILNSFEENSHYFRTINNIFSTAYSDKNFQEFRK